MNTYALSFDGVDDYVQIGGLAGTPIVDPSISGALTVSCWAYVRGGYYILASGAQTNSRGFSFSYQNGSPGFVLKDGSKTWSINFSVPLNEWHHWRFVWDGSALYVYRDGVQIAQNASPINSSINTILTNFTIGKPNNINGYYGNAVVDDVRIWSIATTIDSPYRELTGYESGLVGYWKFNEGTGTTTNDSTLNGKNGMIYGAIWTTDVPFRDSRRYLFQDGSEIKKYVLNTGWIVVGSAPVTKAMFDADGMGDLSAIGNGAIQALTSNTPELLFWTEEDAPSALFQMTALPHPQLVKQLTGFTIQGELQSFTLSATEGGLGQILVLVSPDAGTTWKAWDNSLPTPGWVEVDSTSIEQIEAKGMTASEVNALTRMEWEQLTQQQDQIRFAYYLKQENLTDTAKADALSVKEFLYNSTPSVSALSVFYNEVDERYYGLLFMDVKQQYYSTSLGEVLKYLDMGTLIAGQTSIDVRVVLQNTYNFSVHNIRLWSEWTAAGVRVELSRSNAPFTPEDPLVFNQTLATDGTLNFYVRIATDPGAGPFADEEFTIYVKAHP